MRIGHLLVAGLILASTLLTATAQNNRQLSTGMEDIIIDNILARTSIRSYQDRPVEQDKIEKLLRAGMAAPSAVDKRPWHFVVVTDKDVLNGLAEANPNAGMAARAPLAIVVCGDMQKALQGDAQAYWMQDASAATENILLAAHALGLGAVWTGTYPIKDRVKATSEALALPEHIVPLCTIVIGYPAGENKPKDKWNPENISYNVYGGKQPIAEARPIQESDFVEFDYTQSPNLNPFTWFKGNGLLLASGDVRRHNAMTIGWGALGNVWSHNVNTITVYVAPARYTYEFMERYQYFTVMVFDEDRKDVLEYMGTHSGRDGNKDEALGLHVAYTEHGAPYYLEAREVYECEVIYRDGFDQRGFEEIPRKRYENFPAGIHHQYIGRIVSARRR
jgi:nitroreductase/flavin reductase (DIM6/NTAB) family NADH-FMN oxidoreductase RutF